MRIMNDPIGLEIREQSLVEIVPSIVRPKPFNINPKLIFNH